MSEGRVPTTRVRAANDAPSRPGGDRVLYWMTAFRRPRYNFALQRATELAAEHGVPLLVLEALRCDYPWASDRIHRFIVEGMLDNAAALEAAGIAYLPYLEPRPGAGAGLLETLAARACAVVADDWPGFFLPRMLAAAGRRLDVRLEAVDACGLLPLRAAGKAWPSAYTFRRLLQRELPQHLDALPDADPLRAPELRTPGAGPRQRLETLGLAGVLDRWPSALSPGATSFPDLGALPIDHDVPPVAGVRGGWRAARQRLDTFLDRDLSRYAEHRNDIDDECSSRLSPWLHFGHLSSHEVLARLASREGWDPSGAAPEASGKRDGWWGLSAGAEAFLDQLVTWRELALNGSRYRGDHQLWESLPEWARRTLVEHAADRRPAVYSLEEMERAATHEKLWNAAQGQLLVEGRIHNYLRMLWGKKILHWTASPQEALEIMIELNNRHALDGRDPCSDAGILWCLGRYDRPWGPEREVFGRVRFMTCRSTRRKYSVDAYVARWTGGREQLA